ncbi:MAG: CvpA family protein [Magnetococcus sp. WYHC-3]
MNWIELSAVVLMLTLALWGSLRGFLKESLSLLLTIVSFIGAALLLFPLEVSWYGRIGDLYTASVAGFVALVGGFYAGFWGVLLQILSARPDWGVPPTPAERLLGGGVGLLRGAAWSVILLMMVLSTGVEPPLNRSVFTDYLSRGAQGISDLLPPASVLATQVAAHAPAWNDPASAGEEDALRSALVPAAYLPSELPAGATGTLRQH